MAKSDDAMRDCVAWIKAACKAPVKEATIAEVIEPLRPRFQSRLDGTAGATTWENDTPQMQDNARYMGVLAEFLAKGEPEVTTKHLEAALVMVATKCTVGRPPGDSVRSFWFYCGNGGLQSIRQRHPNAVAIVESVSSKQ